MKEKVFAISDFQYTPGQDKKYDNFLSSFIDNVENQNPDKVFIPGDFFNQSCFSEKELIPFYEKIYKLKKICDKKNIDLYACLGNHDKIYKKDSSINNSFENQNYMWCANDENESISKLKEILGYSLLMDGNNYQYDKYENIILSPDFGSYYYSENSTNCKKVNGNIGEPLSIYKEKMDLLIKNAPSCNRIIVLEHSPYNASYALKNEKVDMVIAGHTHGGAMPTFMPNSIHFGLISPNRSLFPKNVRGLITTQDGSIVSVPCVKTFDETQGLYYKIYESLPFVWYPTYASFDIEQNDNNIKVLNYKINKK